jgi:hypothetical protein
MMMRLERHVARVGEMGNAHIILVRKPEGKRGLRRLRRICKDNIRMDLREIGYEVLGWMHLTQDSDQWWALVKMVMNLRVP